MSAPPSTGPLPIGAFVGQTQRSPADGAYAVLSSTPGSGRSLVAEGGSGITVANIVAMIYAGTPESAEVAAQAYRDALDGLRGQTPMGTAMCLATDNVTGPGFVPFAPDTGEAYCFTVSADFVLVQP